MAFKADSKLEKPKIHRLGSSFFIWSVEDALYLRQYRIIGTFLGTSSNSVNQNDQLLPMLLMPEQVQFLISRDLAKVVEYKNPLIRTNHCRRTYEEWIRKEIDRQSIESHNRRIELRLAHAKEIAISRKNKADLNSESSKNDAESGDEISKRKRRRIADKDDVTRELSNEIESLEEEIRRSPIKRFDREDLLKEVLTVAPWNRDDEQYEDVSGDVHVESESEKLRYAVFKELWEKGYFITTGLKFGGDFLAYAGDPLIYHASHIVICLPDNSDISSTDTTAWCRLGSQVKKVILLCSWDTTKSNVSFKSLTWKRFEERSI